MSILTPGVIKVAADTTLLISRLASSKEKTAALARHIQQSEIFVGIVHTERGRHQILVKGKKLLEDIMASAIPRALRTGGIFVTCNEEALAMRSVFGDGEEPSESFEAAPDTRSSRKLGGFLTARISKQAHSSTAVGEQVRHRRNGAGKRDARDVSKRGPAPTSSVHRAQSSLSKRKGQ